MKRLILVGSPRTNGRSAHLAEMLFEANIDEHPEDELFLVPVSEVEIGPCIGCNACRKKSSVILKDENGNEVSVKKYRCVFDDDMQTVYDLLDDVDEVTVVSPVYFSGAPAPMKCVLDRLQPYFWARLEVRESGRPLPEKRPLTLHVLGEGGDPHGHDALISEVKSSFATADFRLERVLDWVGKITDEGEITADADETVLVKSVAGSSSQAEPAEKPARAQAGASQRGKKSRPKLDLHSGIRDPQPEPSKQRQAQKGSHSSKTRSASKGSGSSSKTKQGKRRK